MESVRYNFPKRKLSVFFEGDPRRTEWNRLRAELKYFVKLNFCKTKTHGKASGIKVSRTNKFPQSIIPDNKQALLEDKRKRKETLEIEQLRVRNAKEIEEKNSCCLYLHAIATRPRS